MSPANRIGSVTDDGGWRRTRWGIFACLFGFAVTGYVQRTGVSIAAERMVPELGLTQVELGWLLNAFLISYTVLQLPGALAGQHFGPRRTLALIGIVTAGAACALAAVPDGRATAFVLSGMLLARFLLGVAQAALFPVATGAIQAWFPVARWGFPQGLIVSGLWLGAALTPPLVAGLMDASGWRVALVVSSVPSLVLVAVWYAWGRDTPREHRGVSAAERAELADNPRVDSTRVGLAELLALLRRRQIALLTASYFLMNYVFYLVTFWAFLYLVQARGFTVLEGGFLASLPFVSAALAAALGGRLCDALCHRYGARIGMRALPLVALPAAAVFLVAIGSVTSAPLAVAMLCLAFAFTELNEGPYWTATMRMAPGRAMAATALLNTGGNLGGVVATPTIAALSAGHRWTTIFALGAACAVAAASLWLFVDAGEPARAEAQETTT